MRNLILYSVICVFLFSSCSVAEPVFISNNNLKFKSINDSILKFSIDSNVFNESNYKYELRELFFNIIYDNQKIGSGLLINPTEIQSKDTMTLPLDCKINLDELQKSHKEIFLQEKTNFYFTGEAFAVHPLKKIRKKFEFNIPYNTKNFISDNFLNGDLVLNTFKIQKANPFSIKHFTNAEFRLIISMQNQQPFDFKIKKIRLSLKSEKTNKMFLEGVLDSVIDVPRLQTVHIPIDVKSNNFNLLQNLGSSFFNADRNIFVGIGYVTISIEDYDFEIPFHKEFKINMNPLGNNKTTNNIARSYYCSIEDLRIKQVNR